MLPRRRKLLFDSKKPQFQPTEISGLSLWMKSDSGITLDGSNNVSAWTDQSASPYNLAQATTTKRPAYVSSVLNGYPALRFDGVDDEFGIPTQIMDILATINKTIFVVTVPKNTGPGRVMNGRTSGNSTAWNFELGSNRFFHVQSGNTSIDSGVTVVANTPVLLEALNTGVNDNFKINGVSVGTRSTSGTWTKGSGGISSSGGGANYLNQDLVEILLFNRTLTAAEETQVNNYIKNKYLFF